MSTNRFVLGDIIISQIRIESVEIVRQNYCTMKYRLCEKLIFVTPADKK